jgi:type II secretory pathway component PulF
MATDPPSPRSALIAAAVTVITHGLLGMALLLVMVFILPGYKREFGYFQMKLPLFTERVVAVSDWLSAYWYVVVFAAFPLLAVDGAIVFLSWRRRGTRILGVLWVILVIALWLLVMTAVALAIGLPYLKLQESLSR